MSFAAFVNTLLCSFGPLLCHVQLSQLLYRLELLDSVSMCVLPGLAALAEGLVQGGLKELSDNKQQGCRLIKSVPAGQATEAAGVRCRWTSVRACTTCGSSSGGLARMLVRQTPTSRGHPHSLGPLGGMIDCSSRCISPPPGVLLHLCEQLVTSSNILYDFCQTC